MFILLCSRLPPDEVYDLITDTAMAADAAMAAAENADLPSLDNLWLAVPGIINAPFAGPYLAAVRLMLRASGDTRAQAEDQENPERLMATAAAQGNDIQRAAGATRLRRLAHRTPSLAPSAERLAQLISLEVHSPPPLGKGSHTLPDAHEPESPA